MCRTDSAPLPVLPPNHAAVRHSNQISLGVLARFSPDLGEKQTTGLGFFSLASTVRWRLVEWAKGGVGKGSPTPETKGDPHLSQSLRGSPRPHSGLEAPRGPGGAGGDSGRAGATPTPPLSLPKFD